MTKSESETALREILSGMLGRTPTRSEMDRLNQWSSEFNQLNMPSVIEWLGALEFSRPNEEPCGVCGQAATRLDPGYDEWSHRDGFTHFIPAEGKHK